MKESNDREVLCVRVLDIYYDIDTRKGNVLVRLLNVYRRKTVQTNIVEKCRDDRMNAGKESNDREVICKSFRCSL